MGIENPRQRRQRIEAYQDQDRPTVDEMREALLKAGWQPTFASAWQSPEGPLYRGPALAYHVMKKLPWPPERA